MVSVGTVTVMRPPTPVVEAFTKVTPPLAVIVMGALIASAAGKVSVINVSCAVEPVLVPLLPTTMRYETMSPASIVVPSDGLTMVLPKVNTGSITLIVGVLPLLIVTVPVTGLT